MGDLTAWVDVALGLSIVFLGSSLFVTIVNEFIAQTFTLRGRQLAKHLNELFDEPAITSALSKSPALASFFNGKVKHSYADPNLVARILMQGLSLPPIVPSMTDVVAAVEALPGTTSVKTQLLGLAKSGATDVAAFTRDVSAWVDQSLKAMGEAYKKQTQWTSLLIGLLIAVAFNVNTIALTGHLYRDKGARSALADMAEQFVAKMPQDVFDQCLAMVDDARRKEQKCAPLTAVVDGVTEGPDGSLGNLPIGWLSAPTFDDVTLTAVVGWLLTALAISLGASFWFDALNRMVNMRHGMQRPEVEDADKR